VSYCWFSLVFGLYDDMLYTSYVHIFTYFLPHILLFIVPWNSGVADISCLESVTSIGY